ncbi:MAG: hypothetical protein CL386_02615 [Acidiferrobacter sp.]|nr:hypothetical protein [Acidiferrobacter sp.]
MWVFTNKGFLSIVQHKDIPDYFQVKSRVRRPLEELWPNHPVEVIGWADYRFRISISKEEVVPILIEEIERIDYTSFKNSCDDEAYLQALVRIWTEMHRYQTASEDPRYLPDV